MGVPQSKQNPWSISWLVRSPPLPAPLPPLPALLTCLPAAPPPPPPFEQARVEAAGGQILFWNGVRVMGLLAVSRAIGDHSLRPYVIAEPEVGGRAGGRVGGWAGGSAQR